MYVIVIDYCSGPASAIRLLCVCVCVCVAMINFEQNDL